ncbi:hypothetical protein HHI36_007775 [Cryptolaemus montrouzieri]|uniref:Uncharacterized protein n=1 Tax=Cryptolaemus montrouzieri TaxID=559131 RepID=A0ABD2MR48_9CUCU
MSKSVSNKDLGDLIRELQRKVKESKQTLLDELEESHSQVVQLEEENTYLRDRIEFFESKNRKNNLIINGLQVDAERNFEDSVVEGLNEDLNNVYIVGKKLNGANKLKLTSYLKKVPSFDLLTH